MQPFGEASYQRYTRSRAVFQQRLVFMIAIFSAIIGIAEGLIIEAYGENNPQINTQRFVSIRF